MSIQRRLFLGSLSTLALGCTPGRPSHGHSEAASPAARPGSTQLSLADLEQDVGGRVGVWALDTQSGQEFGQRADERFALASTFKWVLAAAVLERADRGELALAERVPFGPADLLEHAPTTRAHVQEGALSVEALAEAAVVVSDNTAANLLLQKTGGPAGFTSFVRTLGDDVTRLDRMEPALNSNESGDARDTTSPRAMVHLMRRLLTGDTLRASSRERLLSWLVASETGKNRLRAGLPSDWKAGDKTGTGKRGATGDVAIAWPPGRGPMLIACYSSESSAELPRLEAVHAEVARRVVRARAESVSLPSSADP